MFDAVKSLDAIGRQDAGGATKVWEDLARYEHIIKATKPTVVIECGTWRGGSAHWFASQGVDVISIDIAPLNDLTVVPHISWVVGNSADPAVAAAVSQLLRPDSRVMVVLDSDHTGTHVRAEIELYGQLVTPGCYLVVEDTITRWCSGMEGGRYDNNSPLDAVEATVMGDPDWIRDRDIEDLYEVTMSPSGWWRRA